MAAKTLTGTFKGIHIEVPFDVRAEFGRARPPVIVTINGYTYRSTISVYGGKYFIPVRKSNREAAGLKLDDTVTVNIALDAQKRTVEPPPDLQAALKKSRLESDWEKLSYTRKKEFADVLLAAKKPETRARRVEKVLSEMRAKKK
jgi:Domain of unknown function (DUF1905)/Bacteriocin-protection, YdeI or OmpD-Associated